MIGVNHVLRPESLVRNFDVLLGVLLFAVFCFRRDFREFARPLAAFTFTFRNNIVHLSKGTLSQDSTDRVASELETNGRNRRRCHGDFAFGFLF